MATHPRRTVLPVALLGVVIVLVVAGLWWRQTRPDTAAVVADAPAVPAVQGGPTARAPSARVGMPLQSGPQRQADRMRMREQAIAKRKAASDTLMQRHRTEGVDAQWAPGMEAKLQGVGDSKALVAAGAVPTSLDIQCHTTTCTIDAALPTRSQGEDFALIYMSSVGNNIKHAFSTNVVGPDGSSHIEIIAQSR